MVGCAQDAGALIAGRTTQGVGGGGREALCEIILTDITTLKERPLYIGLLGLMWAGGSILAPIIGGLFAQYTSWRWIAWINLPLMGVALVLLPLFLNLKVDRSSAVSKLKRVDWLGIFLLMVGLTCFVLALAWGGQMFPLSSWQTIFPLIIGLLVLLLFAVHERYPEEPVISPRLFLRATSSIAFLGSFIHGIIIWCLVYYLVLYFQGAIQHAPLRSTIDAFPLAFTLTPSAILCALLIDRLRRYLWSVWLGWLLCTVGVGIMALLNHHSNKAVYSGLQVAPGIGTGFLLSALAVPLQASMTVKDTGVAMGTLVFSRALGSVVSVALGSAIFTNEFQVRLDMIDTSLAVPLPDASDAVYFLTTIKDMDLSAEARGSILELYTSPVRVIWITVSCLAAVGLVSSLFMKELTLEREEFGKQAFETQSSSSIVSMTEREVGQ
ncbi:MAG: hypothetical protein Q9209_006123 [Squamulea sp. 1 TL-2023]